MFDWRWEVIQNSLNDVPDRTLNNIGKEILDLKKYYKPAKTSFK